MKQSPPNEKLMVAVKIDRCWNRHWRLFLFVGVVVMSCITGAMWMQRQRYRMDGLLETNWRSHWTMDQNKGVGSKTVYQKGKEGGKGINVVEEHETFQEYVDDENYPTPKDSDYYDEEKMEDLPKGQFDDDYFKTYEDEQHIAEAEKPKKQTGLDKILSSLIDKRNYTLREDFRNPFKTPPEGFIEFDTSFDNPCWAEKIPRFPYQNNSYLRIKDNQRPLENDFQAMRKRFAGKSEASKYRVRCLPAFYVMETPPMSTPSLFTALSFHPKIVTPPLSEPEYWNKHGPAGDVCFRDYVDLFDSAAQQIADNTTRKQKDDGTYEWRHKMLTGDGTSSSLWTFDSWQKTTGNEGATEPQLVSANYIAKFTPLAKIIFVLRNPTERLLQGYLSKTQSPSKADFHDKVGRALDKMSNCEKTRSVRSCLYDKQLNKELPVRLRIGMYYPFISDWLKVFPEEQIKVIRYEDLVAQPSQTVNEVCEFLGIPPFPTKDLESLETRIQTTEKRRQANQKLKMLTTTKAMLKEFHRHLNSELAILLNDEKFTWPELQIPIDGEEPDIDGGKSDMKKEADARAIAEQREEQIEKQKERMKLYKEKLRQWREQQRERKMQQHEARMNAKQGGVIAKQPVAGLQDKGEKEETLEQPVGVKQKKKKQLEEEQDKKENEQIGKGPEKQAENKVEQGEKKEQEQMREKTEDQLKKRQQEHQGKEGEQEGEKKQKKESGKPDEKPPSSALQFQAKRQPPNQVQPPQNKAP